MPRESRRAIGSSEAGDTVVYATRTSIPSTSLPGMWEARMQGDSPTATAGLVPSGPAGLRDRAIEL